MHTYGHGHAYTYVHNMYVHTHRHAHTHTRARAHTHTHTCIWDTHAHLPPSSSLPPQLNLTQTSATPSVATSVANLASSVDGLQFDSLCTAVATAMWQEHQVPLQDQKVRMGLSLHILMHLPSKHLSMKQVLKVQFYLWW